MNALNIHSSHSPTMFSRPANLTTYTILSLFSLHVELAPHLLSPIIWSIDHLYLPHYKSPTAITLPVESAPFFIVFTLLLVHLILCISPHHSHHLRSHCLTPQSFTPDLKLISFTNPFLHSRVIPSGRPSRIFNLYWTNWALAFLPRDAL